MPDQRTRELSVRRKLNAMPAVFEGKSVLLVDDSIVRGTTMSQIVDMVRKAGAKKVSIASVFCMSCSAHLLLHFPRHCRQFRFACSMENKHLHIGDCCVQVYLASASPPVRFPNVYGVDMPTRKEFVAADLTEPEICQVQAS